MNKLLLAVAVLAFAACADAPPPQPAPPPGPPAAGVVGPNVTVQGVNVPCFAAGSQCAIVNGVMVNNGNCCSGSCQGGICR